MQKINTLVTDEMNFFKGINPVDLIAQWGSPLYVYNESIIRQRAREMKNLVSYKNFEVNYSAKANSNLAFLQLIREEGLLVDAVSTGEIYAEQLAGFSSDEIFFVSNNLSAEEMQYAIDRNILMSVDSISQLEQYGKLNPNSKIAVRFNSGVGVGHHVKVVTGGKSTKFGVHPQDISKVKELLKKYNLTLVGINHHIGSLFMEPEPYINGAYALLDIAKQFEDLEFIDIGGGLGIPYRKQEGQARLDLKVLGEKLDALITSFAKEYGKEVTVKIEPGRYISAESGILLGRVNAIKNNEDIKFIGTDIGFNTLLRPAMYDSHHDIEVFRASDIMSDKKEVVTIVGNICESGDIISKQVLLPEISQGDVLAVLDAGAYGYAMSSNYNNRPRPTEILIRENGEVILIRKRDTFEDIIQNQIKL